MEKRKNNVIKKSISILLLICVLFSCVTCAVNASAVTSNAANKIINLKLKSYSTTSVRATWSLSAANNKKVLNNKERYVFRVEYSAKYYVGNTLKTYKNTSYVKYKVRSTVLKVPANSLVTACVYYQPIINLWGSNACSNTVKRYTLVQAPSVEITKETVVNSKAKEAKEYLSVGSHHTVNDKCTIRLEQYIKKTGKYKLLGTYTFYKSQRWLKKLSVYGKLGATGTYRICAVNAHGEKGPYKNFKVYYPPDRVDKINFKYNGYSKTKAVHSCTFSWNAATAASKYLVTIYNSSGNCVKSVSTAKRSLSVNLRYGGKYVIKIITVSSNGAKGGSRSRTVKI